MAMDAGRSQRERRATPRHPADARMFGSIDGQTVLLCNISERGIAVRGNGLRAGSTHLLEFNLEHRHMTLAIEILDSSGPDMLHARFVDLDPTEQQALLDLLAAMR